MAGVYWLTRRTWGAPAALAGALLLAAGPWAIIFSRKIWAQNLLPPFAIGWGIGAALAFVEGRRPFEMCIRDRPSTTHPNRSS